MENENIIKTIKIKIGKTEEDLTPEQLLSLHEAIGELLNLKTEKIVEKEIIRDRFVPYQPFWYWSGSPYYTTSEGSGKSPQLDKFTISYNTNSSTANISLD